MPSGRKGRSRQRSRRKHQKQLLDRSRRSRDEQINSVLEETDVIAHLPGNASLLRQSVACSQALESSFDVLDGVNNDDIVSTAEQLFGSPKLLGMSGFSTPKRTPVAICFSAKKSKRSLSSPSSMCLSPISSKNENEPSVLEDTSLVLSTSIKIASLETNFWLRFLEYTQHIVSALPRFFSKVCCWFKFILTAVKQVPYNKAKNRSIKYTLSEEDETTRQINRSPNEELLVMKLDEILSAVSRLEQKHDHLISRVDGLERCIEKLKLQSSSTCTAQFPPPPPPPPPPLPVPCLLATTPVAQLENNPPRKSLHREVTATPRPSITLQDILSVQLRKTPAQRPVDKTPQMNSVNGIRGPLVSVDMLRSVKLRPSQLRRRSIERPLQTPSAVFKIRSP